MGNLTYFVKYLEKIIYVNVKQKANKLHIISNIKNECLEEMLLLALRPRSICSSWVRGQCVCTQKCVCLYVSVSI